MKKLIAGIILLGSMGSAAMADTVWGSTYIYTQNGPFYTVYTINGTNDPAPANPINTGTMAGDFSGANLGTFQTTGVLRINAQISTISDVFGLAPTLALWGRVYANGDTPGAFTRLDQNTGAPTAYGTNWLFRINAGMIPPSNLIVPTNGSYSLDVYFQRIDYAATASATTNYLSSAGNVAGAPPTGNFFTANFTVVPEPGTFALVGIGLAGLIVARRRKQ